MTDQELLNLAKTVLTPRQLECWKLSRFHGRSYRAIALMLDLDKSTVQGHVRRAEQKLVQAARHNTNDGDIRASTLRPGEDGDRTGKSLAA